MINEAINKAAQLKIIQISEDTKRRLANAYNNFMLIVALVLGFGIGYSTYKVQDIYTSAFTNPYTNIKSIGEVSVAVNDDRDILIISKSTGEYQVYSDTVGMTIFKLYAARISNQITAGE